MSSETRDRSGHAESPAKITIEDVRTRIRDQIHNSLRTQSQDLIKAPTGSGKSHTVATTRWQDYPEVTGEQPVFHISVTTEARDDAIEKSREAGVNFTVLKGRQEVCPVAKGDHDDELQKIDGKAPSAWFDQKCDVEHFTFSRAHSYLEQRGDVGQLPCCSHGSCTGTSQVDDLLKETEEPVYDVVHMTPNFAHISDLIDGANVICDEKPDYGIDFDQEAIRRSVNRAYGDVSEGYRLGGLMEAIQNHEYRSVKRFRGLINSVSEFGSGDYEELSDTLAVRIVRAITFAKPLHEGLYLGKCGRMSVRFDSQNTIKKVYRQPDLSTARCVIGLDAHPSPHRWRCDTGLDLTSRPLLGAGEEQYFRHHERDLRTVRVGNWTQTLTKGWKSSNQRERATIIIRAVAEKHGNEFRTCVCPKALKDEIPEMMKDAGVENPNVLWYGDLKSRNDFAGESVGLVLGCIDPGDDNVLAMLGRLGLDAKPVYYENEDSEKKRKHGREFTGPDADAADDLLRSVREDNVAQAIGRYARDVGNPDDSALVYIWTTAVADELIDDVVPGVSAPIGEKARSIEEYVRQAEGPVTKTEVSEETDTSGVHAWDILNRMVSRGIASVSKETGKYGADEYQYESGELVRTVDLEPTAD